MKFGDRRALNSTVKRRSDLSTVILHWAAVLALGVALLSGLRISTDSPDASWSLLLDAVLLHGAVSQWHVWAGYGLTAVILGYGVYLLRAGLGSRIIFDRYRRQALKSPDGATRWQARNVAIFWVGFTIILLLAISGSISYWGAGLLPAAFLGATHRVLSWALILYVVIHIGGQIAYGGIRQLTKIMMPRLAYGVAGATAFVVVAAVAGGVYWIDHIALRTLTLPKVASAPVLDGKFDDEVWKSAKAIVIPTARAHTVEGGEIDVTVKAIHDGTTAYFAFEWPDTERSMKLFPMVKTETGWTIKQTEADRGDESEFYEDQFAVMLSRASEVAGGSAHYGSKVLSDKKSTHGRGMHYMTDGSIVDLWQWKAARTGNRVVSQMDDGYIGAPLEKPAGDERYRGGFNMDPDTGGGYVQNFDRKDPAARLADGVVPRRLPKDWQLVRAAIAGDGIDHSSADRADWWLLYEETVPYTAEMDANIPVGTVLPSVLVRGPFQGDRGHIAAEAVWSDGVWRLEVKRALDTGSQYDLPIAKDMYFWVSAFQHAQTRHSYHTRPVRLELGE
ncbi:ethylbenzene dehydrogenase-related protein [Lacibacterium aquatile]|uniref:Ethylbenzene dehydrogenase-related protein n=1 Tax=Lacibacterium aquatile TaxID=1168082 RepID=A0ABW5DLM4_9PROT